MNKYLIEIKYRIICVLIVFFTLISVIYMYKVHMIQFFVWLNPEIKTNTQTYFIVTSITELFLVLYDISLFLSKYVLYYYISYHFISFLSLGLYTKEYFYLKRIFTLSLLLWFVSICVFIKLFLPLTYSFFYGFQQQYNDEHLDIFFEPKIKEYVEFVINLYSQCYICFQCLLIFICFIDYIKSNIIFLKYIKKFIYLLALFLSTLITPPDTTSQIFVFLFFIFCIEFYLFSSLFFKLFLVRQNVKTNQYTKSKN